MVEKENVMSKTVKREFDSARVQSIILLCPVHGLGRATKNEENRTYPTSAGRCCTLSDGNVEDSCGSD
jgi:hypothetical protein